jgi:hypothetical protein
LIKDPFNNNIIEICSVIYEDKNTKSINPYEKSFRIQAESSPDFNNWTKKIVGFPKEINPIIIYPKSSILDIKESDFNKKLNPINIIEFF